MGIIERKQRIKDNTRNDILKAALKIVKQECWQALSMRKIAQLIEYSAPVIYEHFANKGALLTELTQKGFQRLGEVVSKARKAETTTDRQLEKMWMAYWDFAFAEKEYYQLMFGVDTQCSTIKPQLADNENSSKMFLEVITEMMTGKEPTEEEIVAKFFTMWSVVHGLVAINLVQQGSTSEINHKVLLEAISNLTHSIRS